MIPKSGYRFSEKIMLHQNASASRSFFSAVTGEWVGGYA
jgi:hypothetical protein